MNINFKVGDVVRFSAEGRAHFVQCYGWGVHDKEFDYEYVIAYEFDEGDSFYHKYRWRIDAVNGRPFTDFYVNSEHIESAIGQMSLPLVFKGV